MCDRQVLAQYTREFKQEAVPLVRSGRAIEVVANVLDVTKASLGNRVRLSAKGELDGAGGGDKSIQVWPEQMEIATAWKNSTITNVFRSEPASAGFQKFSPLP